MEIDYKEIQIGQAIEFISLTEQYGRAYFQFCPTFNEEGRLMKVYITPTQQPDKRGQGWFIFVDNSDGCQQVIIDDHPLYTMEFGRPKFGYCETHKTVCIDVLTPRGSNRLVCDHMGRDVWFKFMEV
jgi:hypothetical protein